MLACLERPEVTPGRRGRRERRGRRREWRRMGKRQTRGSRSQMEPQIAEANKSQHQQQRLGQADATEFAGPTCASERTVSILSLVS